MQIDRVQVNGSTLEVHLLWSGKGTNILPRRGIYGPLISAITITPSEFFKLFKSVFFLFFFETTACNISLVPAVLMFFLSVVSRLQG